MASVFGEVDGADLERLVGVVHQPALGDALGVDVGGIGPKTQSTPAGRRRRQRRLYPTAPPSLAVRQQAGHSGAQFGQSIAGLQALGEAEGFQLAHIGFESGRRPAHRRRQLRRQRSRGALRSAPAPRPSKASRCDGRWRRVAPALLPRSISAGVSTAASSVNWKSTRVTSAVAGRLRNLANAATSSNPARAASAAPTSDSRTVRTPVTWMAPSGRKR